MKKTELSNPHIILLAIIAITMMLILLSACAPDNEHTEHADTDGDGLCDECELCISHKDLDCDGFCDGKECNETMKITHTDISADGICDKCGAAIDEGGRYFGEAFNKVDQGYIERAIRILSISTWENFEFLKQAYTIAFTNANAISTRLSGTPSDTLSGVISGDAKLCAMVAPGLYGGTAAPADIAAITGERAESIEASMLVSGDVILVRSGDTVSVYAVEGASIWDITRRAQKTDASATLASLTSADAWAVLRPSLTMEGFTPSDPDEVTEVMNEYQKALMATAEAYLLRGESLQYEDVYFGLISHTGEYRWACGQKSPEEYTTDEWGYVNCAVFTYDVYLETFGYALPDNMYTTANLSAHAEKNGMLAFRFTNTTPGNYTEEYMLEIEREFMAALEVGDIINVRRKTAAGTSGHAMLYVGNGRFIHSGGSSFEAVSGVGKENYEPTIRCHKVADYIFNTTSVGGNPFRAPDEYGTTYVTELTLIRPLNMITGEIPQNTAARVENMQGIRAEKLSSHPSSVTVNPGDLITYTFSVFNVGNEAKSIDIYDKAPAGTTYLSGAERVTDDGLYWTVSVGGGERVEVSYTVRVNEVEDGFLIDGSDATVGGVKHRCAATRVKKTLTAEKQSAIITAIAEIKSEGTTLTGLALVNEIYKQALGIEAIFTDTNADSVMREGDESVFIASAKTHSSKYLSTLRADTTYYSSMLVDHLYGGMRFYSGNKPYDRTRLLREHNLVVGDVLIGRTSSAVRVFIWAGEDVGLINLSTSEMKVADFTSVRENIMYYGRDFAVLRPSYVTE